MDSIAVFRSRSEALRLYEILKREGIACAAINTPQRLRLGCGLSVVFPSPFRQNTRTIIEKNNFISFVGFFSK